MKKPVLNNKSILSLIRSEWFIVTICILFLLVLGIFIHDDFGIHWDSESVQTIGQFNTEYIQNRNESFYKFVNRYYGPLFEILLFNITKGMPEQQIYFTRHLITYLFFLLGLIAFYFLNKRIIKQWKLALLGCAFLVISPRIFGDAFYNSKDISFLVVFIFSILTLHIYLEKRTILHLMIHSVSSAALIALRVPGVAIIVFTLGFIFLDLFFLKKQKWQNALGHAFIYFLLTCFFTYLFWPILWHDPINEIQNAFLMMSRFPWRGGVVLYRGSFIDAANLPWHYIPVWMAITIPLGYILLAIVGFFAFAKQMVQSQWSSIYTGNRDFLLLAGWLFVPVTAVILLRSVLYDGWRQMFFIYPAVIVFSIMGVKALLNLRWRKIPQRVFSAVVGLLLMVSIIEPLIFMVQNHPLEMVYFNQLVTMRKLHVRQYIEMEYWGLSYRQGLEYVLSANPAKQIRIAVANSPGKQNAMLLSPSDRERLIYVEDPDQADYFLTNYRYHPEDYPYPNEVFKIRIGNDTIFSVFQMKNRQP
jgi:hypothetical protein